MALILQVVAAALTVLGAGTLYWGTTPSLLSLGNTVMVVGAVIAGAGIVLFGLAAVLGQLGVLAAKLDDLRWAMSHAPAEQPAAVAADRAALPAEPVPEPSPFWREGLPEQPVPADAAPAEAARAEPPKIETPKIEAPRAEVPMAERFPADVSAAPPPRPTVTPPSRESFGLRPLGTAAAIGAAAGLAAGAATASAAGASPVVPAAEKAPPAPLPPPAEQVARDIPDVPEIEAVKVEPARIEPVLVEPVVAEPVAADERHETPEDEDGEPAVEAPAASLDDLEEHLAQALEELKEEVRAAEADIAPPAADKEENPAEEPKSAAPEAHDPMASLEKLLLGDAPARAPVPADEREPGGFMARLRDTFSRPPATPAEEEPAPADADKVEEDAARPVPAAHQEPEPEPEPAEPSFSMEDELEKALKASLEEKPIGTPDLGSLRPEPPVYASPEPRPAPDLRIAPEPRVTPEPAPRPAPEVTVERTGTGGGRDDAMASLVRDFPELNDLLAPKKKAVDPADSLIEDLKGIFEPQSGASAPARQEPVVAPPALPAAPAQPPVPLLREGVIANIPFRLYGDGTIEADLEAGTTRFTSLREFRAHVGG
jgi:hypothetical protein